MSMAMGAGLVLERNAETFRYLFLMTFILQE